MSDEIKELLEHIEILDNTDYILHSEKAKALLDYITNLEQENEKLKVIAEEHKQCTRKHWQEKSAEHYAKEMIYKGRIDKAYKITTEFENWLQDSDLVARATIIDLICDIQKALTSGDE